MFLNSLVSTRHAIKNWLSNQIFIQKFNNPMGLLLFTSLGLVLGSVIPYLGIGISSIIIGGIVALPMVFACMFYHQFGIVFTLIVAFLVQYIGKITNAPIGTSLDGLLLLMISGILINQIIKKDWSFAKDPISSLLLFWIYFNIFQVLNPAAESKMAWLFTVRSLAILNLLYFIACYAFTTLARIKQILNLIVILATITALYGLKQEFGGFSDAEKSWIYQDPERFQLFFQWGRMRTFSLFNDAMTFGVMMAYMGVFCLIYATAPLRIFHRVLLVIAGLLMFWSSIYTGTRTCFALIPMGLGFYALMTLKKEVIMGLVVFLLLGTLLVLKGGNSNPVLFRVKSAFEPSQDASVQIRYFNQKRIRPYIYSHPIGFGPGSTGLWARRFTPDSFLAKFAHDSYYVRLAVEEGWIGMALYMFLLYTVLRRALYFYLRVRDPIIKTLYLSLLSALFMLAVANYPQEAIVQLPTSLVSYVFFAAVVKLKDFDEFYQSVING